MKPLSGRRVALIGKLAGMPRRDAQQLVRQAQAQVVDRAELADLVVLGEHELPVGDAQQSLAPALREAAEQGRLEIVSESELWQRLGLVEPSLGVRRLYTPAMLADLLGVPVATIRRWHRRGLIVPALEVRRLPYFDFQEVANARRLAQLLAQGVSPQAIERQLDDLARWWPNVERPLAQLSLIVEGRRLLLRRDSGLLEPTGQYLLDFDPPEASAPAADDQPQAVSFPTAAEPTATTPSSDTVRDLARRADEQGDLKQAIELLRVALALEAPTADACFELAELLYRAGDLPAARERYYMAVELDDDFVEARANLGCVLAELGDRDLAVAAFEGALQFHPDYADARYLLARTLDELGRTEQATPQWQAFLDLAPNSPWAPTARQRLGLAPTDGE